MAKYFGDGHIIGPESLNVRGSIIADSAAASMFAREQHIP
jgi:hypothetical protein